MRPALTPWRIAGGIVVLLLATVFILYRIPAGKYILLVDAAHPLSPFVHVQGARPETGSGAIYYVDVFERRARELDVLFPWLHPHASFVPANEIVPPCSTEQQANDAESQAMAFSQRVAAAVALRRLGYHVVARPVGVVVSQLIAHTNAPCNLQPMDVIVAADGTPTPTLAALHTVIAGVEPGDVVHLRVRRGGHILTLALKTVENSGRAIIGIYTDQAATFKLPIRVSIDVAGVGGPSAGLAFALEVMQKLGRDVTHGLRIAATGEMELSGAVAPIGGVKQKTYGAREAGADVFLVPASEARIARRFAGPLRIVPVQTFGQALHALATLPRRQ